MTTQTSTLYYLRTERGSILCTTGEFHHESFVGPGSTLTVKTWKTAQGAARYAADRWNQGGRQYVSVIAESR